MKKTNLFFTGVTFVTGDVGTNVGLTKDFAGINGRTTKTCKSCRETNKRADAKR